MNHAEWLIRICAAVCLLGYLTQVPVIAALAVGRGGMGVGVGLFVWKGAIHRAQNRAARKKRSPKRRLSPSARDRRRILRFLMRHGTFEYLRVAGVIALSDAQKTCLAVGAVRAFCAALGKRGDARVEPAFLGNSAVEAEGVVSMRLIHVLMALTMTLIAARHERQTRQKGRFPHGKISH